MMLGDTHGSAGTIRVACQLAAEYECTKIVQVGDFGIGDWGIEGTNELFIEDVSKSSAEFGVPIHFIDGNHEDHDWLDSLDRGEANDDGHIPLSEHLFYIPRASLWEWDDKTWLAMGGAYSIDRAYRKEGVSWWPQERPSYSELVGAVDTVGDEPVHFLLTHDAMAETPWPRKLLPIEESLQVRHDISGLVKATSPRMMFHGHYHMRLDWTYEHDSGRLTEVHGLDCDGYPGSMGVLDTDTHIYQSIILKG